MTDLFKKLDVSRDIFNKVEYIDSEFPDQPQEIDDEGNREYKWKIIVEDPKDKEKKTTKIASQMKFRLYEGDGKALYILGVTDDGDALGINEKDLHETLCVIDEATKRIKSDIVSVKIYDKEGYYVCTIRIYKEECKFS